MRCRIKEIYACKCLREDVGCNGPCSNPDEKANSELNVNHIEIVGEFDVDSWGLVFLERRLILQSGRCPSHNAARVVIDVVVSEDCASKDPKVVHTWKEVYDTETAVIGLTNVSQQVLPKNLNPVVLEHK